MFNGHNPCFISTEGRWLSQRIQDAPTALERAAPCHARPRGQVQARMDDRACRWHRTLPIGRSGDFGTSPLFLQLGQVTDLPVDPKWGRKCKAQWQCTDLTGRGRHFFGLPQHGRRLIGLVMKQRAQRKQGRPRPPRCYDDADTRPSLGDTTGQV